MGRQSGIRLYTCFTTVLSLIFSTPAAADPAARMPAISIIIDDIGYRLHDDTRALALPGPIAYAVLPQSPHGLRFSRMVREAGDIVLLHLPMEALEKDNNRFLGPGGMRLEMSREEFITTLETNLQSVPGALGVSNHMGSLLSMHYEPMQWLMQFLNSRNKFYLDSLTGRQSVARTAARSAHVPYLRRDVFLDNLQDEAYVQQQFDRLIRLARRNGRAIGIGHPHPETIRVLSSNLARLDDHGVKLIDLVDMSAREQAALPLHTPVADRRPKAGHLSLNARINRRKPTVPATQDTIGTPASMAGASPPRP